ncbi:unnamed protein product, partial [Polarella glacialis]
MVPVSTAARHASLNGGRAPELDTLLALGDAPESETIRQALAPQLSSWSQNPRKATVVLSGLARLRLPVVAAQLLDVMQAGRVEVNVFHYNAAVNACEKAGDWQLAIALLEKMPQMSVTPDSISFNSAMSACEKGQQWQLAVSLLASMDGMRVRRDTISFNSAISACEKGG